MQFHLLLTTHFILDAKSQMEHFKSFFGHKYSEQQQQQTTESNGLMQEVQ